MSDLFCVRIAPGLRAIRNLGRISSFGGVVGPKSPWGKRGVISPKAVSGQLRGHRGGGIDLSFVRVADYPFGAVPVQFRIGSHRGPNDSSNKTP